LRRMADPPLRRCAAHRPCENCRRIRRAGRASEGRKGARPSKYELEGLATVPPRTPSIARLRRLAVPIARASAATSEVGCPSSPASGVASGGLPSLGDIGFLRPAQQRHKGFRQLSSESFRRTHDVHRSAAVVPGPGCSSTPSSTAGSTGHGRSCVRRCGVRRCGVRRTSSASAGRAAGLPVRARDRPAAAEPSRRASPPVGWTSPAAG